MTNGLSISLQIPNQPTVKLDNLIWSGGTPSGHLYVTGLANDLTLDLFGDLIVTLQQFDVQLANGGFSSANIKGSLTLPFFTPSQTVNVDIAVKSEGSLSVTLSEQQTNTTPDGKPQLSYTFPNGTSINLTISSLQVTESSGVWTVTLAGSLQISTTDLQWPSFDIKGVTFDSKGHVTIDGGWINLPSQMSLDFYGFQIALHQLGFGNDASGRWIGFSGDINLVEGISLGGSVQGLKLSLDDGGLSFEGVGIDMEIPEVIAFSGSVEHYSLQNANDAMAVGLPSTFPTPANVFAGSVDVIIEAAGDLEIDGQFVVGQVQGGTAFFLSLGTEFPTGIPLFPSVDLYGLSGLFATNLQPTDPTLTPPYTWWDWYKYKSTKLGAIDTTGTEYSATDEYKWLNFDPGTFSLGAGATIGTQDDGYTASAAIAFILMLPGPIISFVGTANILSKRIGSATQDAAFQAMATYDGRSETFDMVIQAQYSIPMVLSIEATAELYADSNVWFLALGKPPHEQRVQARIFDLFQADTYFVVSDAGLITGAWIGYKNAWTFGPLKASIDAYLATLAAVQWAPLQIAGGLELHGELQLSVFGLAIGITADALLEGTAPNPFWVYGAFQISLDLPWPLPHVGATVNLSWGGNDGSVPPVPLALDTIDAMLADHGTSDSYELLAHRAGAPVNESSPGETVIYDTATPGILAPNSTNYSLNATDFASVLPDLGPATLGWATAVPQDSHFTLTFSHQTVDQAGFTNAASLTPDAAMVSTPPIVGKDDMSNLNPNPPAVQWLIQHVLQEVALYYYNAEAETPEWELVAATPQGSAPLDLPGVWLASPPTASVAKPNTLLKVVPYTVEPGTQLTAAWGGSPLTYARQFTDQGLAFDCTAHVEQVTVASPGTYGMPTGLRFVSNGPGQSVTITFPGPVNLLAVQAVTVRQVKGELQYSAPTLSAGESTLSPLSTAQDPSTHVCTLTFDPSMAPITEISIPAMLDPTFLFAISYKTSDIKMPLLPTAPALYALKAVTQIQAGRVGSGNTAYQPVAGNPIIEFAYFQTASGPGVGTIDVPLVLQPFVQPPWPQLASALANNAPPSPNAFPEGGRLVDLQTYFQWSWPMNGDGAAYYGYDFNFEFDETYVLALYQALSAQGKRGESEAGSFPLHFRCVDRNNVHTFSSPIAAHVPSMPLQSALVAQVEVPAYPSPIAPASPGAGPTVTATRGFTSALQALSAATLGQPLVTTTLDGPTRAALKAATAATNPTMNGDALGSAIAVNPSLAQAVQLQIQELQAAAAARAEWFAPLQPRTLYTLDIVPDPIAPGKGERDEDGSGYAPLSNVTNAADAIACQAALESYYAVEDALPTLQRVTFSTSRYATFAAHVANAVSQTQGSAATAPIRYYTASVDPQVWLSAPANNDLARVTAQSAYESARTALANFVPIFDPLFDALSSGATPLGPTSNGQTALSLLRTAASAAWNTYAQATAASFDGLIAALGLPQLQSKLQAPLPPDTELSLLTTNNDAITIALLLESPEPLAWRRLWSWVRLIPQGTLSAALSGVTVLWNSDGTRALIAPMGTPNGSYVLSMEFQGNIGAEAPCITLAGQSVIDVATFAALVFAPPISIATSSVGGGVATASR